MRPILFEIFGIPVYSYGVALAAAFLISCLFASKDASRKGIHPDRVLDMTLFICIAAIIGARLVYIATEPYAFRGNWLELFNLRNGGLAFHGGLIGGILAGIAYCKKAKVDPWKMADITAAPIALGYAVARAGGCFLKGCCYGLPTHVAWAVRFPGIDGQLRHPTQLYSALGGLIIFAVLRSLKNHRKFDGFLLFLYAALYSVERFIVELFRDRPIIADGMGLAQWFSIASFAAAIACILILDRVRSPKRQGSKSLSRF